MRGIVIRIGYGQLIEEAKPDVADMPKEAIHPTTLEEGDFLPQDVKKGYCRTVVDDTIITALTCMIDGYAGKMIHEPESGSGVNIEKIAESLTEVSYRVLFNDDFEDADARK